MRRDATEFEPIPGAAEEGPRRSRVGISRFPFWNRGKIGLLLLALIVLPWLPISGPTRDAALAKRVRGVGDFGIQTFSFAPDGATIAALQSNRVSLRGAKGVGGACAFLGRRDTARALAFTPDARSLVVGGIEPDLFLYRIGEDGEGHPLGMPIRETSSLAVSPDGGTLAASSHLTPEILLWDLAAGRERARLKGHGSPVISLAFSPDGRTLASGARGQEAIVLWDLATRRPRRRLDEAPNSTICLTYSPDGRWLAAAGGFDRSVVLWDSEGRREDRLNPTSSGSRNSAAFSPDGRTLATVDVAREVRLWDLATGAELRRVGDPADRLHNVAFSPDGRTLAAAGLDADIRLWALADLLGAATPRGPRAAD